MNYKVTVLGAGLAGCEAALWLAGKGVQVDLYEQKPVHFSPAHKSAGFAELICSNSLKAERLDSASGLLKEEMRRMGSELLNAAETARVAAGGARGKGMHVATVGAAEFRDRAGLAPGQSRADVVRHRRPGQCLEARRKSGRSRPRLDHACRHRAQVPVDEAVLQQEQQQQRVPAQQHRQHRSEHHPAARQRALQAASAHGLHPSVPTKR